MKSATFLRQSFPAHMSMDSATSESFQSSNGGGDFDDFDSRAPPPDSISSFLAPSPPQPSRSLFNPFPSHHPPSFLSDLDVSSWPPPLPQPPLASPPAAASSSAAGPRSSKKRARASRRAPTTVLTTDTSNFRAMVQEFTGIPAPPFATSSSFSRPRLDLFHSAASAPAFLLRPFAQKIQPAAPSSSNSVGIPSNTLPSSASIQNQNLFFSSQDPLLNLQSMLQEQQRAMALCQWPASGYAGGELGSVIAGASVDSESKRTGNCKSVHAGSSHAEKQQPEGFSTTSPANARGEGGVDGWHISSD
ncbi:hypothetical protein KSP39_PZI003479 [Platanthera zijinensis]|uniref:VQ domain-containing protein n=1 Tax=Platanthera zijinensis TaxID=2320716 RepID=A0AAP0BU40_9ASPA